LKIDNGNGSFSYYHYDPNSPNANNQGYVGAGTEGELGGVTVKNKPKEETSGVSLPWWMDPSMGGLEYKMGVTLARYRLDGYGQGRPILPGKSQRAFDRIFPKGSWAHTRPVDIRIPGTNSTIVVPRYMVSSTGQLLKVLGVSTAVYGGITSFQQFSRGEISGMHLTTNLVMTTVGFMGPTGMVISIIYSVVLEDGIFSPEATPLLNLRSFGDRIENDDDFRHKHMHRVAAAVR
jgi:hypothetical protein